MRRWKAFDRFIANLTQRVAHEVLANASGALAPAIAQEMDRAANNVMAVARQDMERTATNFVAAARQDLNTEVRALRTELHSISARLVEEVAALRQEPDGMMETIRKELAPVAKGVAHQQEAVWAALVRHPLLRHRYESLDLLGYASVAAALESADY